MMLDSQAAQPQSHPQPLPPSSTMMMQDDREYERAACFLQDFHRFSALSLHVIVEEGEEEVEGTSLEPAALITVREKANTGSLSKMEASMCLSSLALSCDNDDDEAKEDDALMLMSQDMDDCYANATTVLSLDDAASTSPYSSSSSSWGQFITSDDVAAAATSTANSCLWASPARCTSSRRSGRMSSPRSVRAGGYYFVGSFNVPRQYHNAAATQTKARVATKTFLR